MALKMCPTHTVSDFSWLSDNALVCFVFCFVLGGSWGGKPLSSPGLTLTPQQLVSVLMCVLVTTVCTVSTDTQ